MVLCIFCVTHSCDKFWIFTASYLLRASHWNSKSLRLPSAQQTGVLAILEPRKDKNRRVDRPRISPYKQAGTGSQAGRRTASEPERRSICRGTDWQAGSHWQAGCHWNCSWKPGRARLGPGRLVTWGGPARATGSRHCDSWLSAPGQAAAALRA